MKPRSNSDSQTMHISDERLADIVRALLLDPAAAGEDMSQDLHRRLRGAIAEVVADYCGGDVVATAEGVEVTLNDSSPEDGGIWSAQIPHILPREAVSAINGVLGSIVRDDEGQFFINQESLPELNALSATVHGGEWLIDGQPVDGIEFLEFPRAEWDATCEYHEFVDQCLKEQYEATSREFVAAAPVQDGPSPSI